MYKFWSLPTRERGLKYLCCATLGRQSASLPTRERGLKSQIYYRGNQHEMSLPTRERGLKYARGHFEERIVCRSLRGSVD